jgi:hypothetical protein
LPGPIYAHDERHMVCGHPNLWHMMGWIKFSICLDCSWVVVSCRERKKERQARDKYSETKRTMSGTIMDTCCPCQLDWMGTIIEYGGVSSSHMQNLFSLV